MTPQENKTWQDIFEGAWTQDWPKDQLKCFIESVVSQTRQDTLREVKRKWNKIHMLDHYDKDNDSYWEKEHGSCHVRSFHIDEYEDFESFLSSNLQKK